MNLKFKHFVFLNVLDVILTWYAITYMGLHEGNPVLNPIFQQLGIITGLVEIKIIGLILLWGMTSTYPSNIKKLALNIICFMFVLVVLNNTYQIIRVVYF